MTATPPPRPRSCPTCSSIGPRWLDTVGGQGLPLVKAVLCLDPWHWSDPAHPEREMPQEMLMGTLPDGPDRTGRLVDVEPVTAPAPDAAPQPSLDDLITANPVAKAAYELGQLVGEWNGEPCFNTPMAAAETALRAALEADAADRADVASLRVSCRQLNTALTVMHAQQLRTEDQRNAALAEVERLTRERDDAGRALREDVASLQEETARLRAEAEEARQALARAMDYDGDEVTTLAGAVEEAARLLGYERREHADLERQVEDMERRLASKSAAEDAARGDLNYERAQTTRFRSAVTRAVTELESAHSDLMDALGQHGTTGPTADAMTRIARAILTLNLEMER